MTKLKADLNETSFVKNPAESASELPEQYFHGVGSSACMVQPHHITESVRKQSAK